MNANFGSFRRNAWSVSRGNIRRGCYRTLPCRGCEPVLVGWCTTDPRLLLSSHSAIPRSQIFSHHSAYCFRCAYLAEVQLFVDSVGWLEHGFIAGFNVTVPTFVQVSGLEGWLDVMDSTIDSDGVGRTPIPMNNPAASLFYVLFILLGSFFMLNVFIGVVVDTFNTSKAKVLTKMTEQQIIWTTSMHEALAKRPRFTGFSGQKGLQLRLYEIVTSGWLVAF